MKRKSKNGSAAHDDLEIPETPPGFFKAGVMGKYYKEYMRRGGGKPVRAVTLEEDVAKDFPTSESVNEALRLVQQIRRLGARKRKKSA